MRNKILQSLGPGYPWARDFQYYDSLPSTNDHLRALAKSGAPQGTAIMAGGQTGGHGRMGRSFQSPEGLGVYLSLLLRPECAPTELMHLTCAAAVAMCGAVEKAWGIRPGIKWTNDLVWEGRKLGGILTELGLDPRGRVSYGIIGIGINCLQKKQDFLPALQGTAASLSMVTGKSVSTAATAAAMLEALQEMSSQLLTDKAGILDAYRRSCITLGRDISLFRSGAVRHGRALDITPDGELVVEFAPGQREIVNCGEVSVRGMYGYV